MKNLILFSFLVVAFFCTAQKPELQHFPADKGGISVQPIQHASMVIRWSKLTIYVDPFGGAKLFEGQPVPDYVLITDIHPDHLNPETLNALDLSKAKLIVPQAVKDLLPETLKTKAIVLNNNEMKAVSDMTVRAMPMYNLPEAADAMHTKGRGNGYVLEMGGKRVYISGDTEDIPEMRQLKDIDIAFVCMNLPYTMDVDQAAAAVNEFRPKVVYPYHYRGKDGFADLEKFKMTVNARNPDIQVRLVNWYPNP